MFDIHQILVMFVLLFIILDLCLKFSSIEYSMRSKRKKETQRSNTQNVITQTSVCDMSFDFIEISNKEYRLKLIQVMIHMKIRLTAVSNRSVKWKQMLGFCHCGTLISKL